MFLDKKVQNLKMFWNKKAQNLKIRCTICTSLKKWTRKKFFS